MFGGPNPAQELPVLRADLDRVGELVDSESLDATFERVSRWSVRRQLAHILLVERAMLRNVQKILAGEDRKEDPPGKPSLLGRLVLAFGWIPRGRGQAPESVVPTGDLTEASLKAMLRDVRADLDGLEPQVDRIRTTTLTVHHFAFGHLTATQWLRFARIHARHHLAIVRDIQAYTDRHPSEPPAPIEETP